GARITVLKVKGKNVLSSTTYTRHRLYCQVHSGRLWSRQVTPGRTATETMTGSSPVPRDSSPVTSKGRATRARIVDAAARLAYERGVAGTSLDDVGLAAGVGRSQPYHYFADKGELLP